VALPGLILRLYRPSDFDTLHAIDQLCFPKHIAYRRSEMKSFLRADGAHCVVAEIPEAIAGFVLAQKRSKIGHIITLDVLAAYRRHSIGSLLLEASEKEAAARGVTLMYLETATTNKAAIALWKQHGYRETATIENFYGRGQNAFEMQKQLAPQS
jgi:[ribosomal protein S18]-alanine N-acetyltransferase